jgi:hypothetical protein
MAVYFGESLADKYALAEVYYGDESHIRTHDWAKETEADKKAALVQSERQVDKAIGVDMDTLYADIDWPVSANPNFRPDEAIFEQALFILDNTVRTKEGSDGAKKIESDEYQEEEKVSGVGLAPATTDCLRMNMTQISRG